MRWIIKTQRANLTADAPGWALRSNDAIRATDRERKREGEKLLHFTQEREMDSLKFFWHFNVMNPYTHLIKLLHVMRRHTWTPTRMEMIVFKMTCIIMVSACMTDEQWPKKRTHAHTWFATCPSRTSVCLKRDSTGKTTVCLIGCCCYFYEPVNFEIVVFFLFIKCFIFQPNEKKTSKGFKGFYCHTSLCVCIFKRHYIFLNTFFIYKFFSSA